MLKQLLKSKKGLVMEWAIVFGILIFALGMILLSLVGSYNSVSKEQKVSYQRQIDLSQIGEYFLRACELGGSFPTGLEEVVYDAKKDTYTPADAYNVYGWMDESTKKFFAEIHTTYGYTFTQKTIEVNNGSFWNFYTQQGVIRKLNVFSENELILSVSVAEDYVYDEDQGLLFTKSSNPITVFSIVEWSGEDNLSGMEDDDLNILQRVWKWIGNALSVTDAPKASTNTVIYNLNTIDQRSKSLVNKPSCDTTTQGYSGASLCMPRPYCSGYKFMGWFTTSAVSTTETAKAAGSYLTSDDFKNLSEGESLTYYAQWYPYKIKLKDGSTTISTKYAKTTLSTREKDGYYFLGWSDGKTTYPAGTSYTATSDISLKAQWISVADLVCIEFDTNGADSVTGIESMVVAPGETSVELPTVSKNGYNFMGWFDENDQLANTDNGKYTVPISKGEIKLKAKFSIIHYTIVYCVINSDGTKTNMYSDSYTIEDTITLRPVPTSSDGTYYSDWFGPFENDVNENWHASDTTGPVTGKYGDIKLYTTASKYTITLKESSSKSTTYEGSVTLPKPTKKGYKFNKWKDEETGKTYASGSIFAATKDTTLVPTWTAYVVTYDSGCDITVAQTKAVSTLPSISRTGYTFLGWYKSSTRVGGAGDSYTPTANVTLTAKWEAIKYTITYSTENCEVKVKPVESTYNSTVQIQVKYSKKNISFEIKDDSSITINTTDNGSSTYTYTFTMPAKNITIVCGSSSCVIDTTLITMADGSKKQIKDIKSGDLVLAWDFYKGENVITPVVFNDSESKGMYQVTYVVFSDETKVGIISEHGFFDKTLNKFVYLDVDASQYIGHEFIKYNETGYDVVTLTDVYSQMEFVQPFDTNTYEHLCFYTNDMLSLGGGISGLFNIFEVDNETLSYNKDKMNEDIETYGLLTLDDYNGLISEEMFNAFNGKYLGISIGKGLITWSEIEYLANRYAPLCQ